MYVVDASVWVSLFLADDIHHGMTQTWMRRVVDEIVSLVCPSIVLAELAGAVARRTGDSNVGHVAVRRMSELPVVELVAVDADGLGQRSAQLAADLKLKGTDAVYVAVASEYGFALVTWDDEQRERAGDLVDTRTPDHGRP